MKSLYLLFLPLSAFIAYFATGSFFFRSATTLLCLAIVLVVCVLRQRFVEAWWVVAAFALSFAGDYVLGHWGGGFTGFVSGVGLFLLAHLGYVGFCLRLGRLSRWLFAVLVMVFGGYYALLLRPAIGDVVTSIAVLAYILISCLSMAAAVGLRDGRLAHEPLTRALYIIGIGCLLFSDLLIAQKRFLHDGTLYPLMMPTYFASQLFVTASLLLRRQRIRLPKRGIIFALVFCSIRPAESANSPSQVEQLSQPSDHISLSANATAGYMTPVAGIPEELLHSHTLAFYDLRFRYRTLPQDGSSFDALFRYPTLQAGITLGDLSHIDVYRQSTPYRSTLGHTIAFYAGFHRELIQSRRFSLGYDILNGAAYCTQPFDAVHNADNEYIGSHWTLYLGIDIEARFRLSRQWTLSAAFDFKHFSAASLVRPNLGVNSFGPMVGVTYDLSPQPLAPSSQTELAGERLREARALPHERFYVEATAAVVPKTLPDYFNVYRTSDSPVYVAYNAMLSAMYRYLLHHASGIGLDYTYVPYTERLHELDFIQHHDVIDGRPLNYSPHLFGVSLRHDIFYRHFVLNLGIGTFLHRQQGWRAETQESRFYQMIGLRYSLPFTRDRLSVGYTVKAFRFSKVDGMYLGLGWRFGLAPKGKAQ